MDVKLRGCINQDVASACSASDRASCPCRLVRASSSASRYRQDSGRSSRGSPWHARLAFLWTRLQSVKDLPALLIASYNTIKERLQGIEPALPTVWCGAMSSALTLDHNVRCLNMALTRRGSAMRGHRPCTLVEEGCSSPLPRLV